MVIFHLPRWYLLQEVFLFSENSAPTVLIQIFIALVIGLLVAFAFQFLLTTLGIAVGISALGRRTVSEPSEPFLDESLLDETLQESGNLDAGQQSLISKIGITAGLGILITINVVLFIACFLAARFSQVNDPQIGAIEGIVIWSAYFLILLWISSHTVTSIVGSVVDLTAGGIRRLVATIAAAFQPSEEASLTETELIDRIRQEIATALMLQDWQAGNSNGKAPARSLPASAPNASHFVEPPAHPVTVHTSESIPPQKLAFDPGKQIATYLYTVPAKKLTPKRIGHKVKAILESFPVESRTLDFPELDRAVLTQILAQRPELSDKQRKRVMQKITELWTEFAEEQSQQIAAATNPAAQPNPKEAVQTQALDPELAAEVDTNPRSIAQMTTHLLHTAAETTLNQALDSLPDLLPQLKATLPAGTSSSTVLAPMVLSLALTKVREAVDAIEFSSLDPDLLQQSLDQVIDVSQAGLTTLNQSVSRSVVEQIEQWRDRSIQQIDSVQQLVQKQLDTIKQQTQIRLETTRKAAALAAWWLFLTASTAALSAALAGALATGLSLPHFMALRG